MHEYRHGLFLLDPAFSPQTGPCAWPKGLRSAMNHTSTSPDSVASPSLQPAQFSIAFISPGRTHGSRLRWHFRRLDPAFSPQTGPCARSKGLRSAMKRTSTSPDSLASPSLQPAQFSIAFISPGRTHASELRWHFRRLDPAFPPRKRSCVRSKGLRSAMKRRRPHPIVWQVPCNNQRGSPSRLSHLEEPTPLNRGGILDDLTRLFHHGNGLAWGPRG